MGRRRVVITGLGAICPIGLSIREFWANSLAGQARVTPIPEEWSSYSDFKSKILSDLPSLEFEKWNLKRLDKSQYDKVSLLAVCAAREALINANYNLDIQNERGGTYRICGLNAERCGVYIGTGLGGGNTFLENYTHQVLSKKKKEIQNLLSDLPKSEIKDSLQHSLDQLTHISRFNPFVVSMLMPNATSAAIGIKFSVSGPNTTFSMACAAGTVSIGHAYRSIKSGTVDVAITGGCEFLDDRYGAMFKGYDVAGVLVHDYDNPDVANCPFDKKRSGFLFSKGGAAILLLEELETAKDRGAPIIAELIGYGETFDAHSMMGMEPDGSGIERMIRLALLDAEVKASEIQYINAHGTGTLVNDKVEAEVVERIFNRSVLINSTKSLIGHTIGASGSLEAVITALSLKHGTTHICKNLKEPISDLNFVREVRSHDLEYALSQSFAFGGHNAGIVMHRFKD